MGRGRDWPVDCVGLRAARGKGAGHRPQWRGGRWPSGGIVGALAPHVPENWNAKKDFQLGSLLMSQAFWAGVQRHLDSPPATRAQAACSPWRTRLP